MKAPILLHKPACLLAVLLSFPLVSHSQLISVRSVPVAAAEQFLLAASQNLGMGGVSIAVPDPSLDPFINPAKGARIRGAYLFSSPVFSNITDGNGGIRSLPLGALVGSKEWFGGLNLAVQKHNDRDNQGEFRIVRPDDIWQNTGIILTDENKTNTYAAGLIGKKLPGTNLSLAASVSWAELEAMQGVDFLYSFNSQLVQYGRLEDYRLGLLQEGPGQPSFELLLLHNRVKMTHDLYRRFWIWEGDFINPQFSTRLERNLDQTNTWGLHAGITTPMAREGGRADFIFTVNHKSHPKIPNYEIMNIPRDPGTTWAFNFGAGLAHDKGSSIAAVDLVFEPIWSHTWADAAEPTTSRSGKNIPAGGKTVENYFRFSNWLVRLGLSGQENNFGFQLGLQGRLINYRLKQTDFIAGTRRTQKESWEEWTPSIGFNLDFPALQIRYSGMMTIGTGQPGVNFVESAMADAGSNGSNFIVAPAGRLTLQDAIVLTHQFSLVIALQSLMH